MMTNQIQWHEKTPNLIIGSCSMGDGIPESTFEISAYGNADVLCRVNFHDSKFASVQDLVADNVEEMKQKCEDYVKKHDSHYQTIKWKDNGEGGLADEAKRYEIGKRKDGRFSVFFYTYIPDVDDLASIYIVDVCDNTEAGKRSAEKHKKDNSS